MTMNLHTMADWRRAYDEGARPQDLLGALAASLPADDPAWILRCTPAFVQAQVAALPPRGPATPLWGLPFAVKDNIDVAGLPTTAACPAFAYTPEQTATAVRRLQAAGAVLVGKTNLDQFATGLVGTRSPYGEVPNSFDARYVSGGSSSGSASVVARGLVPFALGTDTAGSGRVPAGFNNLVGLKPSPGRVPMAGVLPACRTLDVLSVFAPHRGRCCRRDGGDGRRRRRAAFRLGPVAAAVAGRQPRRAAPGRAGRPGLRPRAGL